MLDTLCVVASTGRHDSVLVLSSSDIATVRTRECERHVVVHRSLDVAVHGPWSVEEMQRCMQGVLIPFKAFVGLGSGMEVFAQSPPHFLQSDVVQNHCKKAEAVLREDGAEKLSPIIAAVLQVFDLSGKPLQPLCRVHVCDASNAELDRMTKLEVGQETFTDAMSWAKTNQDHVLYAQVQFVCMASALLAPLADAERFTRRVFVEGALAC